MLNHAFMRHEDPSFGSRFGGGCAYSANGGTCGYPERSHPKEPDTRKALVDALRAEYGDGQLEAILIQLRPHFNNRSSLGHLVQVIREANSIERGN